MKIYQLSDTHFFSDPCQLLWQTANPYENLKKIIAFIKTQSLPDLILLTGDLSQDDTGSSYEHLAQMVNSLNVPVYFIPGNHDNLSIMQSHFQGRNLKTERIIKLANWAFILLDSTQENLNAGHLNADELNFLKKNLAELKNYQIMVVLHHHPVPIHSALMDQYILSNGEEFMAALLPYKNVRAVLFGHVHQAINMQIQHINLFGCPATSVQFPPYALSFAIDPIPPGFRWLKLENENFFTGITRVE